MSMLFLCTNYNFSGCAGKGTNIVVRVDSKIFDRRNKERLCALNDPPFNRSIGCTPWILKRSIGQSRAFHYPVVTIKQNKTHSFCYQVK